MYGALRRAYVCACVKHHRSLGISIINFFPSPRVFEKDLLFRLSNVFPRVSRVSFLPCYCRVAQSTFTIFPSSHSFIVTSYFFFFYPCPSEYIKYFDRYYQLYINILYLYIYIDIYIYIYVYIYIPISIYVRIRVYIHVHIDTYIHTYIHTYIAVIILYIMLYHTYYKGGEESYLTYCFVILAVLLS